MNLYKRCTAKPYSFLVIATLASDISSHFRNNLSEGLEELMMTIDDEIKNKKLQYDITKKAAKYQYYHLEKFINMNILQVKKCCHLIKVE